MSFYIQKLVHHIYMILDDLRAHIIYVMAVCSLQIIISIFL